jgi:hypothetical protein
MDMIFGPICWCTEKQHRTLMQYVLDLWYVLRQTYRIHWKTNRNDKVFSYGDSIVWSGFEFLNDIIRNGLTWVIFPSHGRSTVTRVTFQGKKCVWRWELCCTVSIYADFLIAPRTVVSHFADDADDRSDTATTQSGILSYCPVFQATLKIDTTTRSDLKSQWLPYCPKCFWSNCHTIKNTACLATP